MSAAPAGEALLDRDAELCRIQVALARAREGHGTLLVVEGPAGIGKTRVLAAGRGIGREEGMQVLRARGAELEGEFAFGIVRQLFEPILAATPDSDREELMQGPAGKAARLLGLGDADGADRLPAASAEPPFAVLHGLYWLCANLASHRPLLLAVDDAHWADVASLRFVAFLLPRLEGLRVAILLATRSGEGGRGAELVRQMVADPAADLVRPGQLSESSVGRLIEAGLGAAPEPAFVQAVARATGGTPFLVHSLVRVLGEEAVVPDAEAVPTVTRLGARSIGRWLALRLRRLPRAAARLARAVAVLENASVRQAAGLAMLSGEEAADAVDALVAAEILTPARPLSFAHPVLRAAVYEDMGAALRTEGHRRAARLLAGQPSSEELVVRHLLAAEPAGDAEVVERLVTAARVAARSGAPESAAAYLLRALEEPPAPGERAGLLLELGMAEANAGRPEAAEHLGAAVAAAPDASARVAAALAHGYVLGRMNGFAEALEVFDRAALTLGPGDEQLSLALEAAALIHATLDVDLAPANAARIRAARERAASDAAAPRELLAVAGLVAMQANEPADQAAELARRALAGGRRPLPEATDVPWFPLSVGTLIWSERYAEAAPVLDAAVDEAQEQGDPALLSGALAYRGVLAVRRGELVAAEADARTALEPGLPVPEVFEVLNVAVLVETLIDQDGLEAAEAAVASLSDEAEAGLQSAAILRQARGRLRLAQRRVEEGLADLLAVGDVATRTLAISPSFLPWRSQAAMAQLVLGDRESAGHLAERELELARDFGAPRALGVALRVAGIVAGGERGEDLLREAVSTLAGADAAVEHARALADLGASLRRSNRRVEARALLEQALEIASGRLAHAIARRAETELRATGARPRKVVVTGLDSLTGSERRVAELAAEGLTNREIAQSLFVTARTVEGHLSHVFQKLDLSSRAELPGALSATP